MEPWGTVPTLMIILFFHLLEAGPHFMPSAHLILYTLENAEW